jgi:hypothetical protein
VNVLVLNHDLITLAEMAVQRAKIRPLLGGSEATQCTLVLLVQTQRLEHYGQLFMEVVFEHCFAEVFLVGMQHIA